MEVEPAEEGEIKISTTGDCSDAVCDGSGEVGEGNLSFPKNPRLL